MIQTWRLDTGCQSLILGTEHGHLPQVIYWGASLPDEEDLELIYQAQAIDVTGGMLDENPKLSICPEASRSFPGHAGIMLSAQDSIPIFPKFHFDQDDFKNRSEVQSLTLTYLNEDASLCYEACFNAYQDSHIISAESRLTSKAPVQLNWLAAPVMPASQSSNEMVDFSGRWCGEFQEVKTPWNAGIRFRENRTGRTGHEHFPGLIVPDQGATNTLGKVYGFHYGWSGGHKMIAEELPDGRRQIQFGNATSIELNTAKKFKTSLLFLSYSDRGVNGIASAFQRHVRNHIVKFPKSKSKSKSKLKQLRPVHYNCWEALYFGHNMPELLLIASQAADLGAERFVLDDGWFGTRDDDTRALSEWEVDPRKYPDGLNPLIEHVHSQGMSFGIWFEPEMINPVSSVYAENSHWALGEENQVLGRNQKVLNMDLPEVRNFLFDKIAKILENHKIDYIKWDHNRVLPMPDAAQTRGSYALFDRLLDAFPHVEIESCASGGGRIDFGILSRTHRVWLSDSNDAMERARIQYNASTFLPSCITGSHVGPRICHTSGRVHDIHFRAWIAAQRHMGFEMDPRELTNEETKVLSFITSWWKGERDWLMDADILRLNSNDPAVLIEQHLASDQSQFVIFVNKLDSSLQIAPRPFRVCDLDQQANYEVDLVNRHELHKLSRGSTLLKTEKVRVSGAYLMNYGLTLPWSFPGQVWVLKGRKL